MAPVGSQVPASEDELDEEAMEALQEALEEDYEMGCVLCPDPSPHKPAHSRGYQLSAGVPYVLSDRVPSCCSCTSRFCLPRLIYVERSVSYRAVLHGPSIDGLSVSCLSPVPQGDHPRQAGAARSPLVHRGGPAGRG